MSIINVKNQNWTGKGKWARETHLADRFVRWRFTVRCRLRGCWRLRGIPFLLSFEQEPLFCLVLSVRYGRRSHSSTSQIRTTVVYCPQEPRQGRPSRLRTKLNKIKILFNSEWEVQGILGVNGKIGLLRSFGPGIRLSLILLRSSLDRVCLLSMWAYAVSHCFTSNSSICLSAAAAAFHSAIRK